MTKKEQKSNNEQKQIDKIIGDKTKSDESGDLNLAYMTIKSNNEATSHICVSMEQLQKIRKILASD